MVQHAFEYSKSSRAKCHGPVPCKGSSIGIGTLRYGQTIFDAYGERVEWRHWGCVTPQVLTQLASIHLDSVIGFRGLRPEDQARIRKAISARRVDPSGIPETAKILDSTQPDAPGPTRKKRKAAIDTDMPSSQRVGPSAPIAPLMNVEEEAENEESQEEAVDELYCTMTTTVVGVQYYNGLVGSGEEVRLVREPQNPFDGNAIQVKNIASMQVGHIPKKVAARLAPLMDRNQVTVEGVVREGNLTGFRGYSLSMTLKIYGASDRRDQLEPLLIWATPRQRGFSAPTSNQSAPGPSHASSSARTGPRASQAMAQSRPAKGMTAAQKEAARKQQEALQKAAELKQMLNGLERVDDEGRRSSLLDKLCSTDDILTLPLHSNPPGIKSGELVVDLLKHQSQALQWCVEHEYPVLPTKETDKPVQFWQLRKNGNKVYYYNIATKTPQEAPPALGRGALCADSMGLGKTLTMLALILATKKDIPTDFSKSTLIVVPLSVMSNWEQQIEDHCTPGALTSCVYYGTNRSMTSTELMKFDVVVTTYQTVAGEYADVGGGNGPSKKRKKIERSLFGVQWKRIILDEGHSIRNPKTKMAKAVCGLNAQRRWVLSGTPIINSPRDLGSILTFLQICRPLDNEDFCKRLLLRPLKDGDPAGAELLRALMSHMCIRRTKEMQDSDGNYLVPLPPVEMTVVPVALHAEARALYDAVEELSKQRFETLVNQTGGTNLFVQTNVLSMLTRLRQLALHPALVPSNYLEQLKARDDNRPVSAIRVTPEDKIRLQGLLAQAIEDQEECPICYEILVDPRVTVCAHLFCLPCISEVISRDPKCPMDRRPIDFGELIEPAPPTDLTQAHVRPSEEDGSGIRAGSSAKIDQLVHLLQLTPATEKSLVFSQFTSFLDKIAETLEEQGISYVRFDGQMSAKRREENLRRFARPLDDYTTTEEGFRTRTRPKQAPLSDEHSLFDDDSDFIATISDDDFIADEDDEGLARTKQRGKGKARAKKSGRTSARTCVDGSAFGNENPKVMLISLKAGALGLNLTVASNVYLMDPWWQEGIESQAIDRCNRIGQTKTVHVYQLIAENTVESKVIEIQERKKLLIQQAFSGTKRTETQRQKKEARLQDLVELFGIRQAAS